MPSSELGGTERVVARLRKPRSRKAAPVEAVLPVELRRPCIVEDWVEPHEGLTLRVWGARGDDRVALAMALMLVARRRRRRAIEAWALEHGVDEAAVRNELGGHPVYADWPTFAATIDASGRR